MRRALTVTMLFCASCSPAVGSAPADAGDAGAGNVYGDVAVELAPEAAVDAGPACGAPPYVTFAVAVKELAATNAVFRLPGARLSIEGCDTVVTADASGLAQIAAPRGVAFTPRLDAEGHVPIRFGERFVRNDDPITKLSLTVLMPVTPNAPGMLEYGSDIPMFAITLQPRGADSCGDAFYAFITAAGDVHYMTDSWPNELGESTGPTGSMGPVVLVTGLENELDVAIGATKEHCTITIGGEATHQTGRFHTSAGVLTVADVVIDSPR